MVLFVLLVDLCCFGGTSWEIWISVATNALVTGKTPRENFERLCSCISFKSIVTQACHHQSVFMLIVYKWTLRTCSKRCAVLGRLSTSPGSPPTSHLLGWPFLILKANIGDLSVSTFGGWGRGTLVGPDEAVNVGVAHGREQCCSAARVRSSGCDIYVSAGLYPERTTTPHLTIFLQNFYARSRTWVTFCSAWPGKGPNAWHIARA